MHSNPDGPRSPLPASAGSGWAGVHRSGWAESFSGSRVGRVELQDPAGPSRSPVPGGTSLSYPGWADSCDPGGPLSGIDRSIDRSLTESIPRPDRSTASSPTESIPGRPTSRTRAGSRQAGTQVSDGLQACPISRCCCRVGGRSSLHLGLLGRIVPGQNTGPPLPSDTQASIAPLPSQLPCSAVYRTSLPDQLCHHR